MSTPFLLTDRGLKRHPIAEECALVLDTHSHANSVKDRCVGQGKPFTPSGLRTQPKAAQLKATGRLWSKQPVDIFATRTSRASTSLSLIELSSPTTWQTPSRANARTWSLPLGGRGVGLGEMTDVLGSFGVLIDE
jgi:hypothetical protein